MFKLSIQYSNSKEFQRVLETFETIEELQWYVRMAGDHVVDYIVERVDEKDGV